MSDQASWEDLPGDLMMWVLVVSELLVFGAGLLAFMGVRVSDPAGFAEQQSLLNPAAAGINTVILVTSGFLAACALPLVRSGRRTVARLALAAAAGLGIVFLMIKGGEFAAKAALGIDYETHAFFTFYYLLTGFHAAHVVAGIVILGLVSIRLEERQTEAGTQFWHMVDLVWLLLFPVIYLL